MPKVRLTVTLLLHNELVPRGTIVDRSKLPLWVVERYVEEVDSPNNGESVILVPTCRDTKYL
jgi:hypothetical protein